jgi:ribosomal protein L11 methyltransferase
MDDYIELRIPVNDDLLTEILIARLAGVGAEGFEEEKNLLKAFIPIQYFNLSVVAQIVRQNNLEYSVSVIKSRNWNAEWESNFQPVTIGDFCTIRASFHAPLPGIKHDIVVTPKMSFGTGHHATTYMMIQAMARLSLTGISVFDFGTGTGILAILAEKSGASSVFAIDNDDWSIKNATENFNINNCHKILLMKEKWLFFEGKYDLILANISRHTILENLVPIKQHLTSKGVLLVSGLLEGDQPVVLEAAEKINLKINSRLEKNGWICLEFINNEKLD